MGLGTRASILSGERNKIKRAKRRDVLIGDFILATNGRKGKRGDRR